MHGICMACSCKVNLQKKFNLPKQNEFASPAAPAADLSDFNCQDCANKQHTMETFKQGPSMGVHVNDRNCLDLWRRCCAITSLNCSAKFLPAKCKPMGHSSWLNARSRHSLHENIKSWTTDRSHWTRDSANILELLKHTHFLERVPTPRKVRNLSCQHCVVFNDVLIDKPKSFKVVLVEEPKPKQLQPSLVTFIQRPRVHVLAFHLWMKLTLMSLIQIRSSTSPAWQTCECAQGTCICHVQDAQTYESNQKAYALSTHSPAQDLASHTCRQKRNTLYMKLQKHIQTKWVLSTHGVCVNVVLCTCMSLIPQSQQAATAATHFSTNQHS